MDIIRFHSKNTWILKRIFVGFIERAIMKSKDILRHFTIIGSGTLISMIIGLLTTPIITRIVSPEEFGQLSIFIMYAGIAVMVLCLGLDQSLVRYYYIEDNIEYKRTLLFKCVFLPIVITIGLGLLFFLLVLGNVIEFGYKPVVVMLLCLHILSQLIYRFSLLLIRLEYKSKQFAALNILSKVSYMGIAVPLIFFLKGNFFFILVVSTFISGFLCLIISILTQYRIWNFRLIGKSHSVVKFKELIKYGSPFIISMGVTQLFQAVDKISLSYYCTYAEVGIYASAMSLVSIFGIIQSTFNSLWAPMAVEHYENDKDDRLFYQTGNQYITIIMFAMGFSLTLMKDIFSILLGSNFREAANILPFLIFIPIMYTISETTVSGIVFMKKSKIQIIIGAISFIVNLIGNLILVPVVGSKGAAISTGISYIVFFSLRTMFSNRYFYVNYHLKKFYILTLIAVVYAGYNTFFDFNAWSIIGYVLCIIVLVYLYNKAFVSGIQYLKNMLLNNKRIEDN